MSRTATRPVRAGSHQGRGAPAGSRPRASRPTAGRVVSFLLATAWLIVVLTPIYYLVPLYLSKSVAVLPLGLTKLEGQYIINVPAVMAVVMLSVLPLVVLFIVMRKQVMRSLGSVVMR